MVDEAEDNFLATIDELIGIFRDALISMVPIADRARLSWGDVNPHDDWEKLAECLFDVFVRGPITSDRDYSPKVFPIARYDFDLADYRSYSWIRSDVNEGKEFLTFVRLLTRAEPFDTAQFVKVDTVSLRAGDRISVPWRECKFVLVRRSDAGILDEVRQISAIE